jgi:dTDP-4-dehydrorhamnose reductase
MKALVFGQTGQVALELARTMPAGVTAQFLGRAEADLTDPAACAAAIHAHRPDVVINAAAYTAVDKAEAEEPLAHVINAEAPGAMAVAAAALGVPFLHVSTDYVFNGTGLTRGSPPTRPARRTPMAGPSWPVRWLSARRAAPMRSCARRGCSPATGPISSRR